MRGGAERLNSRPHHMAEPTTRKFTTRKFSPSLLQALYFLGGRTFTRSARFYSLRSQKNKHSNTNTNKQNTHASCPSYSIGWCLQGNRWFSPPASMTSRLASVTFKMANKVFIEETNKNFQFITAILFRFFGSRDFKSSQCYRKTDFGTFLEWNVQWCNEF